MLWINYFFLKEKKGGNNCHSSKSWTGQSVVFLGFRLEFGKIFLKDFLEVIIWTPCFYAINN